MKTLVNTVNSFPSDITKVSQFKNQRNQVFLVTQGGTSYVMKVFPTASTSSQTLFKNEKRIASSLDHPNILPLVSSSRHVDSISSYDYILTPFCPNQTLYDLLAQGTRLNDKEVRTYFHQLVEGIEYMHQQGIAHMDLKPCNILIDDEYQLRIFDFDLSYVDGDKRLLSQGTTNYRAPELIRYKVEDPSLCDIYTLGVLLFVLHNGCRDPFQETDLGMDGNRAKFNINPQLFWSSMKKFFKDHRMNIDWTDDFKDLFEALVQENPEDRYTFDEIKASKWYQQEIYSKEEMKTVMENKYI